MNEAVLKLNSANLPIQIISWQDAITDWINGKVEIVSYYKDKLLHSGIGNKYIKKTYNESLNTWEQAMNMPAVIRLYSFVKPDKKLQIFKAYNRINIYARDEGECQYCGKKVSLNKYEIEHVIPQGMGGKSVWNNVVVACHDCNSKKGMRTPKQAGMTLLRKPFAPLIANSYNEAIYKKFKSMKRIMSIKEWQSWIYWNVELEE